MLLSPDIAEASMSSQRPSSPIFFAVTDQVQKVLVWTRVVKSLGWLAMINL